MVDNDEGTRRHHEVLEQWRRCEADRQRLLDAVRRDHDDNHDGVLRWCRRSTCVAARAILGRTVGSS